MYNFFIVIVQMSADISVRLTHLTGYVPIWIGSRFSIPMCSFLYLNFVLIGTWEMLTWGVNLSQKWLQHLLLKGNRHVKGSSQNLESMILMSSLLYHTQAIVLLCELQGSFAELWKSFAEMKSNYFSNEWLSATSENMELMRTEKSLDATKRYNCAQASLAQSS